MQCGAMKGRRESLGTACKVTWGVFWAIWEAHGPSKGPSGDEVGTGGVHQWQSVGPKRVQGGPCAPKCLFYNGFEATRKASRREQKIPG